MIVIIVNWVLLGIFALTFIASIVFTTFNFYKKSKKPVLSETEKVNDLIRNKKNKNGKEQNDEALVEIEKNQDIELEINKTYKVGKNEAIAAGKYTLLIVGSGKEKFNIKIDKFVKEHRHGDVVVLEDGEEITSITQPVILRG